MQKCSINYIDNIAPLDILSWDACRKSEKVFKKLFDNIAPLDMSAKQNREGIWRKLKVFKKLFDNIAPLDMSLYGFGGDVKRCFSPIKNSIFSL